MKYTRIEVQNFRPFYDRQVIKFSTDPDRPVTLIFGVNGGGKTTLLTAMWWCLYGNTDVDPNTPPETWKLFNKRALREIAPGSSGTMSVELELVLNETVWRILRTYTVKKDDDGNELPPQEDATITEIAEDQPTIHRDTISYRIDQILHKRLAPYFFHAAEMLQFPFDAGKAARERLRDCVYRIVGQVELESVISQARNALERAQGDRQRIATRAEAHSLQEAAVGRLDEEIEGIEADIGSKTAELDALEPVLTRMVGELHKAEAFAPLARELEAARDHLDTAKQLEEAEANSQKERTKSLWMVQAKPLMASFFEWFEPRAEGFPRIVNQNLILHMERTGKCICGHDLTADEIEAVKAMVGEGDDQASRRLTHLFDTAREWDGNADQVRVAFEEGLADMAAKQEAVSAAKDRLREAEEAIAGAGKGPQDLDALRASVVAHSRAKSELDGQITICEGLLATKNAERADLMRGAMADASDDLKLAHGKELAIGQVVELATSMRDAHADLCRPKLEECMNENYWVMKASRKILVDDNWLVDTYDEVGEDEFPIGGGGAETTLLTYAFAAATAKMIPAFRGSGVLNEIPDATDMAEAETYPLVVDAPFSSLGRTYQTRVAEKLPKSVHQLILFNESTHLKHFKSMKEKGLIGKLYAVVFTGELKGVAEDEKSFEFAGHEITYVIDETDNELSGSKMQEFAIGQ